MVGNKPVKKLRSGAISLSIFKNQGTRKNGDATEFNTIVLQRAYKDKEDNWQNSNSLRQNDLPRATLLLNKAYEHLVMKGADVSGADQASAEDNIDDEVVL